MAKNIMKEIIIVLLLALAIILILGILLYEYVPSNKIIPEQISYITPEKAKEEIASMEVESGILDGNIIPPYTISATDLKNYEKVKEYVPGKKNPFSELQTENSKEQSEENSQATTENNNTDSTGTTSTNNNTKNENTTGYIPDKGTK